MMVNVLLVMLVTMVTFVRLTVQMDARMESVNKVDHVTV